MMSWRSVASVVVMLVVAMSAVAMAAVVGPKNPRYPDYIVEPKVKCSSEGVFPHPRNCSWYYRCVDRMNVGFYYTYLFECGPGTVFDDGLDQCVFPFMTAPPCGTGTGVPPPLTLPPLTPPSPPVTPPSPPVTQPRPPITQPRPPVTPPSPPVTPPSPPVTPPSPPVTNTGPVIQCAFRNASCQTFQVCQPTRATKTLCDTCYVANTIPIQAIDICGAGQLIDKALNQCVRRPTATDLCQVATPPPSVPISTTNVLRCSDQQTRPQEAWIVSRYCQVFALCDASKTFKGRQQLCTNYYQCNKNPNGSWSYELRNCVPPLMYSFTSDTCVPRPSANELC